ncbi:MAG: sigma-70 family RNA polymerase sigma factor [Lachnospiraceae bacterium]|nr:sigma-70 family RNA polymerase sigma factor [Lachnospiraceae bacterium]
MIAWNILHQNEDCEECVNDTWLKAWNSMPPEKPDALKYFLSAITRNLSLDCYRRKHSQKRGGGQTDVVLEELEECLSRSVGPESEVLAKELTKIINGFLGDLSVRERKVFIRRYYFVESTAEIAKRYALTETNVRMILSRTRKKLAVILREEGYVL